MKKRITSLFLSITAAIASLFSVIRFENEQPYSFSIIRETCLGLKNTCLATLVRVNLV